MLLVSKMGTEIGEKAPTICVTHTSRIYMYHVAGMGVGQHVVGYWEGVEVGHARDARKSMALSSSDLAARLVGHDGPLSGTRSHKRALCEVRLAAAF